MPPIFNWKYGCLGGIIWMVVVFIFAQLGMKCKDAVSPEVFLAANIAFFGIIIYYLQQYKTKKAQELSELAAFTEEYNERVKTFNYETGKLLKSCSKDEGSTRYYQMRDIFNQETYAATAAFHTQHPNVKKVLNTWKWLSVALVLYCMVGCNFQFGLSMDETPSPSSLISEQENRLWSADNITLPHLTNGDLYVSNPDSILSANTVDSLNAKMKILDRDLGIETAVVVVNHLKDDDPFRFSQDLFAKYGIGKDDRGLVIVMAYGDHSINMSTGSSLEADLTDAECKRLQTRYLIPYVKEEQPDSGMLLLADGLIAMMSKKEMPTDADTRIASLKSNKNDLAKEDGYFMFYLVMLVFWYFVVRKQSNQMNSLAGLPGRYPASNPFYRYTTSYSSSSGSSSSSSSYSSSSSSSYSSSSSSSSSSSGSSGGYNGGHSSGGGATSRW